MPRLSPALFCSFYKNWPKKYIDKEKGVLPKKVFGNRFGAPDIIKYDVNPDEYDYSEEHRPWQIEAKVNQIESKAQRDKGYWWKGELSWEYKRKPVSTLKECDWFIFRGDEVEIMVGKDKGKHGIVTRIVRELDLCYVRGLNCKYIEITPAGFEKQVLQKEIPLNYVKEEVLLVDPDDRKPTTVSWRYNESGERLRMSVRSNKEVLIPSREFMTFEYKTRESYRECNKDTRSEDVESITWVPVLKTFEQDLSEEYKDLPGYEYLKDDEIRKYKKTYWY